MWYVELDDGVTINFDTKEKALEFLADCYLNEKV